MDMKFWSSELYAIFILTSSDERRMRGALLNVSYYSSLHDTKAQRQIY